MNNIATIKEKLVQEFMETGTIDIEGDAGVLTDALYDGLDMGKPMWKFADSEKIAKEEYELIYDKMLEVVNYLAEDVEQIVNELSED